MKLRLMKLAVFSLSLMSIVLPSPTTAQSIDFEPMLNVFKQSLQGIVDSINELKKTVADLSRQTMLQQFAMEERSRINSDSGIKGIRYWSKGLKNYESPSFTSNSVFSIHDHSNIHNTIGMGEVSVMMNGVNFRTRHNDYKLVMPSTTSKEFRATEPIPFPEVPDSVKGSLDDQVAEMIEWFRAFKTQNRTHRDYTKYFKPVLCYMEGSWTLDKDLQEPFSSDRHKIEASSWFDLQEKLRFSSYSGTKNSRENFAYLPTSIFSVNKTTGTSNYAQWNYRILCKPCKRDIPLSMLKYVDDLSCRMRDGRDLEQSMNSRAARFKLYDDSQSDRSQILDKLFSDIPGMDNLPDENLTQATFGNMDLYQAMDSDEYLPLKTGFYHRQYKTIKKGANGLTVNSRGFSDENLWVAQTTQNRVAPMAISKCRRVRKPKRGNPKELCDTINNRFSYAIPLEIIYLTPLQHWNPYNLNIHQDDRSSIPTRKENGGNVPYVGIDLRHYHMTPYQLFQQRRRNSRVAGDTTRGVVNVLDRNNQTRRVMASGTRILLDEIKDVGLVRLRYPIAPVADEGSSVWKELSALKDYIQNMKIKSTQSEPDIKPTEVQFEMSTSANSTVPEHTHSFYIPYLAFRKMVSTGGSLRVSTDEQMGHTHDLRISYLPATRTFFYERCDRKVRCFDKHPKQIYMVTTGEFTKLLK